MKKNTLYIFFLSLSICICIDLSISFSFLTCYLYLSRFYLSPLLSISLLLSPSITISISLNLPQSLLFSLDFGKVFQRYLSTSLLLNRPIYLLPFAYLFYFILNIHSVLICYQSLFWLTSCCELSLSK